MDQNSAIRRERQALLRFVVLLAALASLADRAVSFPAPLRQAVLWLLRPAEAAARRYASNRALDFGCRMEMPSLILSRSCDGPADALALAEAFDLLAIGLEDLANYICAWLTDESPREQNLHLPRPAGVRLFGPGPYHAPFALGPVPYPDTS